MAPTRTPDVPRKKGMHTCQDCGRVLSGDVARHRLQHAANSDDFMWQCAQCSYMNLQRYNVQMHYVREHTNDKPYECDYAIVDTHGMSVPCTFACQTAPELTRHKKDKHNYNPKTDRKAAPVRTGRLSKYDAMVIPPRAIRDSPTPPPIKRSQSPPLDVGPSTVSYTIPPHPSVSMMQYSDYSAISVGSMSQLMRSNPCAHNHPPKQEPLDVVAFTGPFPPCYDMKVPAPQHAYTPTPYYELSSQQFPSGPQYTAYGHSTHRW